jgi:hypothetical protein
MTLYTSLLPFWITAQLCTMRRFTAPYIYTLPYFQWSYYDLLFRNIMTFRNIWPTRDKEKNKVSQRGNEASTLE